MSSTYDASKLLGTNVTNAYDATKQPVGTSAVTYPAPAAATVSPQMLTPRVWAAGLNALELASSGKVAMSLKNAHAIDFVKKDGAIAIAAAAANDNVELNASGTGKVMLKSSTEVDTSLRVNGTALVTGEVTMQDNVNMQSSASVGTSLGVGSNLTVGGTTELNGAVTLSDSLTVVGEATMQSDMNVQGSALITGLVTTEDSVVVGDACTVRGDTLTVGGARTDAMQMKFDTTDSKYKIETGHVNGIVMTAPVVTTSQQLVVGGASTLQGNVVAAADLSVAGASTLTGNVNAGASLSVADSTHLAGAVSCASTLAVSGSTTLSDDVTATAALTVGGAATFTSAVSAGTTLDVAGDSTLSGAATIGGDLDVAGTSRLRGDVTADATMIVKGDTLRVGVAGSTNPLSIEKVADQFQIKTIDTNGFKIDAVEGVKVSDALEVGATMAVTGASTLTGAVTTGSNLTVGDEVTVEGAAMRLSSVSATPLEMRHDATADQYEIKTTHANGLELNVPFGVTVKQGFEVEGASTLDSAVVTNHLKAKTFTVTDLMVNEGNFEVQGDIITHRGTTFTQSDADDKYTVSTSKNALDIVAAGDGTVDSALNLSGDIVNYTATSAHAFSGPVSMASALTGAENATFQKAVVIGPDATSKLTIQSDTTSQFSTFSTTMSNGIKIMNDITVEGDVNIRGVLNSIAVTEETLHIKDKVIHLGHQEDETDYDEQAVSGAGLHIDDLDTAIEKSFRWNANTAGTAGIASNASTESFWEVKGGSLRMSHGAISYGFRINANGEMEIIKIDTNAADPAPIVVGVFGITL